MSARRVASVEISISDSSGHLLGMLAVSPTRVLYKERDKTTGDLEDEWKGVAIQDVLELIATKGTMSTGPY